MRKTILLLLILSLTSCCTMVTHQTRTVLVTSEQSDTEITIDGFECGTAPFIVDLDKRHPHTITGSKPGYQQQSVSLRSQHSPRLALNFAAPVTGAAIGAITGFCIFPYPPFNVIVAAYGAGVGLAIGAGVGVVGAAVDHSLRSDCQLHTNAVHFNLIP